MHKLGYSKARVYFNIIKNMNNTIQMYFIILFVLPFQWIEFLRQNIVPRVTEGYGPLTGASQ